MTDAEVWLRTRLATLRACACGATHVRGTAGPDNLTTLAGEAALDGANPTVIATGLRAVTSVTLTLKSAVAPGDNTSTLTYDVSGGTVNVYAWKNTGGTDPTLVASTGTETFSYVIVGY